MIYITTAKQGPFLTIKGKEIPKVVITQPKPQTPNEKKENTNVK